MGTRGPVPKRSNTRIRRNKESVADTITIDGQTTAPPVNPKWGAVAKGWYRSLIESGQARYFEPSDWQQAIMVCELLTGQFKDATAYRTLLTESRKLLRELKKFQLEQDEATRLYLLNDIGKVGSLISRLSAPPAAAMIKEIAKMMSDLGTTESARRRMRIEVARADADVEEEFNLPPLSVVSGGR